MLFVTVFDSTRPDFDATRHSVHPLNCSMAKPIQSEDKPSVYIPSTKRQKKGEQDASSKCAYSLPKFDLAGGLSAYGTSYQQRAHCRNVCLSHWARGWNWATQT